VDEGKDVEGSGLELISRILCGGMENSTNNSLKTASRCPGRDMNRGITDSCTEYMAILWLFFPLMYVWGRKEMHTQFWRENLGERDPLQDLRVDGTTVLKYILRIYVGRA
jgi:hypothetical protein